MLQYRSSQIFIALMLSVTCSLAHAAAVTLQNGWNLIALPSGSSDPNATISDLFDQPGISSIFTYRGNGWQSYNAATGRGSLGSRMLTDLAGSGLWVKSDSDTEIVLTLDGSPLEFDPSALQPGWNLIGGGNHLTSIEQLSQVLTNYATPEKLFAFNGGWRSRNFITSRGSLTEFSSSDGLWLYAAAELSIEESIETTTPTRINLDVGITVSVRSSDLDGGTSTRQLTLELNGNNYRVTVPSATNYTLFLHDTTGDIITSLAADADDSSRFIAGTVEILDPNGGNGETTLYAWGLPLGAAVPQPLGDVEIWQLSAAGDTTYLATMRDPIAGWPIPENLDVGTTLRLTKSGYLDTTITLDSGTIHYALLQQLSTEHGQLLATPNQSLNRLLQRPLAATGPLSIPSQAQHQSDVALLFETGRDNPSRSINVRLTPYRNSDAIVDLDVLGEVATNDFATDHDLQMSELNDHPNWNWQVIAGARINVRDMSNEQLLTPDEASADQLGAFATIDPYQGNLLTGHAEDYLALLAEFGSSSGNNPYIAEIDLYARRANGWQRVASGVQFIDPQLPNGTIATQQPGNTATPIDDLNDAKSGYQSSAALRIKPELPLDRLILTSRESGSLMLQGGEGGLHDYAFVLKQLTPNRRTLRLQTLDATTAAPLANVRVTLAGSEPQLSDDSGYVTFSDLVLPLSDPIITVDAVRHDYYRASLSLAAGEINSDEHYPLQLRPVISSGTVRGRITDAESGDGIADAQVRLIAPAALAALAHDPVAGQFHAYADPQADYHWRIRVRNDSVQSVQQGALARRNGRLQRVLEPDQWRTVKQANGSSGGYQLDYDTILQELTNVGSEQDSLADYYLVGNYDLQLEVSYDIDQDGIVDFREVSGDGTALSVAINGDYLTDISTVGGSLSRFLFYPVSAPSSVEPADYLAASEYQNNMFELRGSPQKGFYYVYNRVAGSNAMQPRVYWEIDIRWFDPRNSTYRTLVGNEDVDGNWSFTWQSGEIARNTTIALSDPARNTPLLNQQHLISRLSHPALVQALLEPIDATNPNGPRYLDEVGSGGVELVVRSVIYANEAALNAGSPEGNQTNLNPAAGSSINDIDVPFVYEANAHLAIPFSQQPQSLLQIHDATAVPSDGIPERTMRSDADGYYQFTQLDLEYGAADNSRLASAYLRVTAARTGYYDHAPVAVPKFSADDATTVAIEDVAEQSLALQPIPPRDLQLSITAGGQPIASATIDLLASDGTHYQTVSDLYGQANFEALPIGRYQLTVAAPATTPGYDIYAAPLLLTSALNSDGQLDTAPQRQSVALPSVSWLSPIPPIINATISEVQSDGTVIIEGQVLEYRDYGDGQLPQAVPYGSGDDGAPLTDSFGQRLRDAVTLQHNGSRQPIQLSATASFRFTVTLNEGYNQLQLHARNHAGSGSSLLTLRSFFPTFGSVVGQIRYDHDALASSPGLAASGAIVTLLAPDGSYRTAVSDDEGYYRFYNLLAGDFYQLQATFSDGSSDYVLPAPELFTAPAGSQYEMSDMLLLRTDSSQHSGAPLLQLDSWEISGQQVTLIGRVGNYDGAAVGSSGTRPIQLLINDAEPLAVEVSGGPVWHFTTDQLLPAAQNRLELRATNLNGEQGGSVPLYLNNPTIQFGDVGLTVSGSGVAGSRGLLYIYDAAGQLQLSRPLLFEEETITQSLTALAYGQYSYEVDVTGFARKLGGFRVNQASAAYTISLATDDHVPLVDAGTDHEVNEQRLVTLVGSATDSGGEVVSYRWVQRGGNVVVLSEVESSNGAMVTFTAPQVNSTTVLTFELQATDNDANIGSDEVIVTVQPVNIPPVAVAGVDVTVAIGEEIILNGVASHDSDGGITQYLWTQSSGPEVVLSQSTQAVASFTAPIVSQDSYLTITLTVTDNEGATATDDIRFLVLSGNAAPVANAGDDRRVTGRRLVELDGSLSNDQDGYLAVIEWQQIGGSSVELTDADKIVATFTAPDLEVAATLTFELSVTDNEGVSHRDQVVITVEPTSNLLPTAEAGLNQWVQSGELVTLNGEESGDEDGTISRYDWQQIDDAYSIDLTTSGGVATFTAPDVSELTSIRFQLTVTDSDGGIASDEVSVTVRPATIDNQPLLSSLDVVPVVGSAVMNIFVAPPDINRLPKNDQLALFAPFSEVSQTPFRLAIATGGSTELGTFEVEQGQRVEISASSNSSIIQYLWQYGDSGTATGANFNTTFIRSGNYPVTLDTLSVTGTSRRYQLMLSVVKPPDRRQLTPSSMLNLFIPKDQSTQVSAMLPLFAPLTDAHISQSSVASLSLFTLGRELSPRTVIFDLDGNSDQGIYTVPLGQQLTFIASNSSQILSYRWHYGDSETADNRDITLIFNQTGSYTIGLTILLTSGDEEYYQMVVEAKTDAELFDIPAHSQSMSIFAPYPFTPATIDTLEINP